MQISEVDYAEIKEGTVVGRYVNVTHITPFLERISKQFLVEKVGESVQGEVIKSVTLGRGNFRVLLWSQMHGNESTTTKAVLDLLNFFTGDDAVVNEILSKCTLKIIPILNPDGARAYTRFNANEVDLNRDAQDLSQPESRVLKIVYHDFKPHYCFNLHDQRTIFNVGKSRKSATVSFLAPAHDPERSTSPSRFLSMQLIVAMNNLLQTMIPGQIGRYDDGFNANCVGDAFQMLNTPTILFEAGHYPGDYEREKTREYIFYALLQALTTIAQDTVSGFDRQKYADIPENGKQFADVVIRNVAAVDAEREVGAAMIIRFKEQLQKESVAFIPQITYLDGAEVIFGHVEYDCLNTKDLELLKNSKFSKYLHMS